jgi:hypothetical protein
MATQPPYPQTGTLADLPNVRLPELQPVRPTAAPIEDPASLSDVFSASKRTARVDRTDFNEIMIRDGYSPIVSALGLPDSENPAAFDGPDQATAAKVGNMARASRLATAAKQGESPIFGDQWFATRDLQERLIADQIRLRRQKDPKFLAGVPDTVPGLHQYFLDAEAKKRREAQITLSRSPGGVGGFAASLAGGAVETFHDPVNLLTLPIGGGGKTLLGVAAREVLVNGVLELAQQPIARANRRQIGEDLTLGEAVTNSLTAAAGGAVLGTGVHVGGLGLKASGRLVGNVDLANSRAYKIFASLPQRLKDKWGAGIVPKWGKRIAAGDTLPEVFGELDNRELAGVARDVIGDQHLTPEEAAAGHVAERSQDVGESSPFKPGPAGDAAHEQSLGQAFHDIEDGLTPDGGRRVPFQSTTRVTVNGETSQLDVNVPATAGEVRPAAEPARAAVGQSTARRPQEPLGAGDVGGAVERFKAKVYHAENATGNVHAKNPESSASGPAQFTDPTFRDYYRKVYGTDPGAHPSRELKDDPKVQAKLLDALTADHVTHLQGLGEAVNEGNLYLEHFLGSGDAARVFKAAPDAPIERVLSADVLKRNSFLRGKSASETIAWAHGKMGGAVPSVGSKAGFASTLDAASDDPAIAQLRAEALQLDEAVAGATSRLDGSPVNVYSTRVRAGDVLVDADRFQFKSGGDSSGVTDRLRGVEQWDPVLAGRVMLWEDRSGKLFVADGHQRVGLAKRIGADTPMDTMILREADGVSSDEARTIAALKNVAEGTGSAIDAAKVVRGADMAALLKRLPPRSALVRDAGAIARLSDDAFGAVYNGIVAPDIAAVVGHLVPDQPELHGALIDLLAKTEPATRGQAESIVRQGMAAGFHVEHQEDMFGGLDVAHSLFAERAKVLEKGLAELKKMRLVHKTAAENKGALEKAGSTIAAERSAEEAQANAQAAEIVSRLAFRGGPVADALNAAARKLAAGERLGSVAREFADAVRGLDLRELDAASGGEPGGAGRLGDVGEAQPTVREEPADSEQPSLLELEQATERFSDPDGEGVKQQAESLVHDLRADLEEPRPGKPASDEAARRYKGDRSFYRLHDQFVGGAAVARGDRATPFHEIKNDAELAAFEAGKAWQEGQSAGVLHGDFSGTKILGDEGTAPLTVHHFTYNDFERFDRNKILERFPNRDPEGIDRVGFWFTTNPEARYANAEMGGRRVDAELNIQKPLYIDDAGDGTAWLQLERMVKEAGGATKFREELAAQGHDGVVLQSTKLDGFDQTAILALEPDQIRIVGKDGVPRLDHGAAVDPAIAARQSQELALKAASPLQSTSEQHGTMGLELFNRDQLGLELDDEARSLLDELAADEKAIKAIKDCL